jgi:CRP-like cAMP-binding protein
MRYGAALQLAHTMVQVQPMAERKAVAAIMASNRTSTERLVLFALVAAGVETERGEVTVSAAELAQWTGLCARAVVGTMRKLEADRWVHVRRREEGGATLCNSYRVTPRGT